MKNAKLGKIYFIITVIMFGFLLITPFVPNPVGIWMDNQILDAADFDIQRYRTGEFTLSFRYANGTPASGIEIGYNQSRHEFLFGALFSNYNVSGNPQNTTEFNELFVRLFNFATLPFYWTLWESDPGQYPAETRINQTIEFCRAHNITVKGHPVFWSFLTQEPSWTHEGDITTQQAFMQSRVASTVGKYKGVIDIWDFFNEFGHWEDDFHGVPKKDFMKTAAGWAKDMNPDCTLLAADFSILGHGGKGGEIYDFYADLVHRGVQFDVMSIQAHQFGADAYSPSKMYQSLNAFAQLGKPIHLTEYFLTSQSVPFTNGNDRGLLSEDAQAYYMAEFYKVAFSHPAVESIGIWGLSDDPNRKDALGILDAENHPKASYWALDQLINHEWHSAGSGVTNAEGELKFRGFYGNYDISIPILNSSYSLQASSKKNNHLEIIV